MKKIVLVFAVTITMFACDIFDKFTQFDMEYNETVVIPSSTGVTLPFNVVTPDVETNSESKFAVNDTRKELIEEIVLTQLDLTLTSPSNGDFGFLKSIEIYITAEGLSDVKAAWKDNIPSDVEDYLVLETTSVDLKEFIKKDEFALKVKTVTDELLATDHHIDIHSEFFVDAEVLGQ